MTDVIPFTENEYHARVSRLENKIAEFTAALYTLNVPAQIIATENTIAELTAKLERTKRDYPQYATPDTLPVADVSADDVLPEPVVTEVVSKPTGDSKRGKRR